MARVRRLAAVRCPWTVPLALAVAAALAAGCGGGLAAPIHPAAPATRSAVPSAGRGDVPEPAVAPPAAEPPAGRVVPLRGEPEGLAVDARDQIVAAGIRQPEGVVLASTVTGQVRRVIPLPGAPRHLAMAGPAGPLLAPLEDADRLVQIALPGGTMTATSMVGNHPHDATAIGSLIFVGNEYNDTVSLVRGGREVGLRPAPVQPGGVAADQRFVLVVGVRGRRVEAYSARGHELGTAPAGTGPTHVQAGPRHLFYVADTQGGSVLIFRVGVHGPTQARTVPTADGAPYGIAVDHRRGLVYVTLTATNRLESFMIRADSLIPDRSWPTVRQPNSVAVDQITGRVFVAGRTGSQLEMIDPGRTPGSPATR